jgi:hypothetical protein
MRRLLLSITALLSLAVVVLPAMPASAASGTSDRPAGKGLYISPVRQYITLDADASKVSKITVGNHTEKQMVIRFSVKAFSVKDLSYSFVFSNPTANTIAFDMASVTLKPGENKSVPYSITLPKNSKPGGQYYTLFATGTGETGNARQQIQATSLLYLTVNGKLIRSGSIVDGGISHFSFKPEIPFFLTIRNTGNVHYFAFINADADSLFHLHKHQSSTETHLLMPGTTRRFESSLPIPQLPGVYHVAYGYTTDFQQTVKRASYALYIPPWFIALLVIIMWVVWVVIRHRRRRKKTRPSVPTEEPTD